MGDSPRLVIVADDLSGAADAAAGFLATGHSAVVTWGTAGEFKDMPPADVLSIDTRSRRGSAGRARSLTFAAVEAARALGATTIFKKIDSTLRGHVAEELDAALSAWDPDGLAIVAPAFPEAGRTTVDGCQRVHDVPLPGPPIAAIVAEGGLRASTVTLSDVREARLSQMLRERWRAGDRAVVCDAETTDDLTAIAKAGATFEGRVVWVGAAGLARALAGLWSAGALGPTNQAGAYAGAEAPAPHPESTALPKRFLIVVGSASAVSKDQAAAVVAGGAIQVSIPADDLVLSETSASDRFGPVVASHLKNGHDVVVTISLGQTAVDDERLVAGVARVLQPVAGAVGGLVVTGGETAMHLFKTWGIAGLRLIDEIEPGVPRSRSLGRIDIPIITKAGAFGDRMTLERARHQLRRTETGMTEARNETAWPSR